MYDPSPHPDYFRCPWKHQTTYLFEDLAVCSCGVPPSDPVDGAVAFRVHPRPDMNCHVTRHFPGEDEAFLLSGAVRSEIGLSS